jgi:hypothetical protein
MLHFTSAESALFSMAFGGYWRERHSEMIPWPGHISCLLAFSCSFSAIKNSVVQHILSSCWAWLLAFYPSSSIISQHLPRKARSPCLVFSLQRGKDSHGRAEAVIRFARVVMLAGAGLSFIVFMPSAQAVTDPAANSRYLVALVIALPAMFWPLWDSTNAIKLLDM